MDRVDLDHLEALHRAATPGPWETGRCAGVNDEQVFRVNGIRSIAFAREPADAALIAAARNALPALLARLRALEEVARAAGEWAYAEERYEILCGENPDGGGHNPGLLQRAGASCDHAALALRAALAAAKEGA